MRSFMEVFRSMPESVDALFDGVGFSFGAPFRVEARYAASANAVLFRAPTITKSNKSVQSSPYADDMTALTCPHPAFDITNVRSR